MLVDLRRCLHVQLAPDDLLGKGLHGINCTILASISPSASAISLAKAATSWAWAAAIFALAGSVVARYAVQERTALELSR